MKSFKFLFLALMFCSAFIACDKDEMSDEDTQELAYLLDAEEDVVVDALIFSEPAAMTEARATFGGERDSQPFSGDCFTLVFPVEVSFPDGSNAIVDNATDLRAQVRQYLNSNPRNLRRNRLPNFVYPMSVQLADGTIEVLETRRELLAELRNCTPDFTPCYSLIFPIEAQLGAETSSFNSAQELRDGITAYRTQNPDGARVQLVYPLSFESYNGDTVSVADRAQYRRLVASCRRDRARTCFTFEYPLEVVRRNGNTQTIDGPIQLRRALSHANARGRWMLQYPLDVTVDGATQTLADAAALRALVRSCR